MDIYKYRPDPEYPADVSVWVGSGDWTGRVGFDTRHTFLPEGEEVKIATAILKAATGKDMVFVGKTPHSVNPDGDSGSLVCGKTVAHSSYQTYRLREAAAEMIAIAEYREKQEETLAEEAKQVRRNALSSLLFGVFYEDAADSLQESVDEVIALQDRE